MIEKIVDIFLILSKRNIINKYFSGKLTDYNDPNRKKFLKEFREIKKSINFACLDEIEGYFIYMCGEKTQKIAGDIAEVGVYKGGTAALICKVRGDKSLYLFDTFEGIPGVDLIDTSNYKGEIILETGGTQCLVVKI